MGAQELTVELTNELTNALAQELTTELTEELTNEFTNELTNVLTKSAGRGEEVEKAQAAAKTKTTRETSISQKALGNHVSDLAPRASPLAHTNETKRFPGWGHFALARPTSDRTHKQPMAAHRQHADTYKTHA